MTKQKQVTEIIVPEATGSKDVASVESFISKAIEAKAPVETIEKFFALMEKVKANQAKEAYVSALARFQATCPIIQKTKKVLNKDGRTVRYVYAPIDSIVEQIRASLASNGLSYRWNVENQPTMVKATCTITHVMGHNETSSFEVPIDPESYMTAPQRYASASTFARRYSLCNALGISTGDEDTDATDVNKEKDAKSVKAKIVFLLRSLKEDTKTKESIESAVKKLAQLDLKEENYGEIVSRLSVLVEESNENSQV